MVRTMHLIWLGVKEKTSGLQLSYPALVYYDFTVKWSDSELVRELAATWQEGDDSHGFLNSL